jgi:alpha-glucosidase
MMLMNEAYEKGRPFTRSLLLHFENDVVARGITDQFMLGENLLVAPAFKANIVKRAVYLPGPATWTHMWSGEIFEVLSSITVTIDCELGYPAVFYRDTSAYIISQVLAKFID